MLSFCFPRVLAATVTVIALLAPAAQAGQASSHVAISPVVETDTPGKIEVLEFFTYACGPCAAMEPRVEQWAKSIPADVVLKQVPVAFNAGMQPLQQLYYSLQALNRADLHAKVFTAIHQERRRLFDKKAIREWVLSQGVDGARFDSVFDSFGVQAQVLRANNLFKAYRIDGTPSFVVGGKYVTSPAMAGNSYAAAIDEIDKLIPMARN